MPAPSPIPIDDLRDPRVAPYANVKDRQLRRAEGSAHEPRGEFLDGTFLAEGELVVRALLRSRFRTRSVLLTPTRLDAMRDALESLPEGTPVYVAPQPVMDSIVGFPIHRGVLACGERGSALPIDALLDASPRGIVVLEDLTNHDNIGAMFRNVAALAEGFGVLLSPRCADPLYRKSLRVSMGHVLRVPYAWADPWPDAIDSVKARGHEVLALTPDPRADDIHAACARTRSKVALLLGSEGPGLTAAAMARADRRVRIPMAPGTDSLNVAVAGAVALALLGRTMV